MHLKLSVSIKRAALRWPLAAATTVAVVLFAAAFGAWWEAFNRAAPRTSGVTLAVPVPEIPPPWPLSLADEATRTVEGEFRSGNTLGGVLQRAGVSPALVEDLVRAARPELDPRRVRSGRPYKVYFDSADRLMMFQYQPDRQTAVLVALASDGWRAKRLTVPYDVRPRYVHAEISGSLEGALANTWLGRGGAIDLAQKVADIFAWDIDFAADLRPRDTVDLIVEQRYLGNERAGFGDVLAAELRVAGRTYRAVRYQRGGRTSAYFTPTGGSLQRAFLRSPVKYTRISSRFASHRVHPLLNVVRPHQGVDFSAPAGTPVHATAGGVVTYVGRNSQAGNHVKIRHAGSYTSWYLHLARFADDLRVGQRLEQGEVIGYVGRTGLATSDHLHYQLERGGQFVDPLKVEFPTAAPLPAGDARAFAEQRDNWMGLLRQAQRQSVVELTGSS